MLKLVNLSNKFHEFFVLVFQVFVSLTLFQNKKFLKIYSFQTLTQAPIFPNAYWLMFLKI